MATRPHSIGSLEEFWALIDAWARHMAARGLTTSTIEQREAFLLRFMRQTRSSPETVTEDTLDAFFAGMQRRNATRDAYIAAIRGFYRWAVRRGHLEHDPSTELVMRPPRYGAPDFLRPEEIAALLEEAKKNRNPRRWAAIVLLFETGARIGSLAAVEPRDIRDGTMAFRVAKFDRPYAVPVTALAQTAVDELLEIWEPEKVTLLGGVAPATIGDWFRETARKTGLKEGRVNAHLARHTAATMLYARSRDPIMVKNFLNHDDLSVVHRYARVTDTALRKALGESLSSGAPDAPAVRPFWTHLDARRGPERSAGSTAG